LPDISLPDSQNPTIGQNVFSAGWGTTSQVGNISDVLLNVEFKTIDDATCKSINSNSNTSFCARGNDTCQGKISF
jgi:hypothetical protein